MSDALLRITAVSGGRRSDLVVPGGVAVAELVPDLARAVGLLDPAAVYAGYRLLARGRPLRPDRGLREQGVEDGALLAVATAADPVVPAHDDLAEAVAEEVDRSRAWEPADTRRTTAVAGLVALALGLGALARDVGPSVPAAWSGPAAVVLVLTVLAGHALPAASVALGVARADDTPVDAVRVAALVARSGRLLLAGSAAVGVVCVAALTVAVHDAASAALAVACCVVLLLRARRHRAAAPVLVDAAGGVAGLLATSVVLAARLPHARPGVAAGLVAAGLLLWMGARPPVAPSTRQARLLDLLETTTLTALAPLLLLATDGLARLTGA